MVERQIVLPFKKSVEIALKSIQVRFFRSLITLLGLVLAVAFLSFVQLNTDIADGLLQSGTPHVRQALIRSGFNVDAQSGDVGSSAKQKWIVVLSLLVCVAGIVNAQLMAVTERFREIGTMKCLGALDRFIVRIFLIEAAVQGLVGAAVGALAGASAALTSAMVTYGRLALQTLPWGQAGLSLLTAIGVGVFLSLVGVAYPAVKAARMQPVEAMRVEQ